MIYYEYALEKDGKFEMFGRTSNRKYIDNLIKYKRRGKRYKLEVVKGTLVENNGNYELVNCETLFEN